MRVLRRWWPSLFLAVAALVFLSGEAVGGHLLVGAVIAVALLAFAWLISPALFPRSADLDLARRRAEAGEAPLVFWKPGCSFCIAMRLRLVTAGGQVSWVDSSVDEDARALVRSLNGGNHTTRPSCFVTRPAPTRMPPGSGRSSPESLRDPGHGRAVQVSRCRAVYGAGVAPSTESVARP